MTQPGTVVIGRNEGKNLLLCLESLVRSSSVTVYVDSGSTDGSVAMARSLGVDVVELDTSTPFTAARARNAGFDRLFAIFPQVELVQFVDGDCEVVPGWLDRAVAEITARSDAAVVCGRRRERYAERSVYNRLADLEWDTPVGEALACGGDAMYRCVAFREVGGFDPALVAGEEPELCLRLRRAGWRVFRVDADMTRHDLNMLRLGQWWTRQVRFGYAELDVATRHSGGPFVEQTRRALLWTVGWSIALTATLGIAFMLRDNVPVLCLIVVVCAPLAQAAKAAIKVRRRVPDWRTALIHGGLTSIGKWAEVCGHLRYLNDRAAGRKGKLIEYKPLPSDKPARNFRQVSTAATGPPYGDGVESAE